MDALWRVQTQAMFSNLILPAGNSQAMVVSTQESVAVEVCKVSITWYTVLPGVTRTPSECYSTFNTVQLTQYGSN
jgi:hypothetical protein